MQKICRKTEFGRTARVMCLSYNRRISGIGFPSLGGGFDSRIPLHPRKQRKVR